MQVCCWRDGRLNHNAIVAVGAEWSFFGFCFFLHKKMSVAVLAKELQEKRQLRWISVAVFMKEL